MTNTPLFAVIGGSGLYHIPGLTPLKEHKLDTPFGKPSAPIIEGEIHDQRIFFLARHGKGHSFNPSQVNYRANIYALKKLGANRVISINACGSLREDYKPGDLVIPDQIFDLTKYRANTFFEDGLTAHVGVADPFCPDLSEYLFQALKDTGATVHKGGPFVIIEGPRFSTRAESNAFRLWGMAIVGMTSAPEAFLAREAELCYAVMNHVTDYDVWHESEEAVSVDQVIKILNQNTVKAQQAIRNLVSNFDPEEECEHHDALASALITDLSKIPAEKLEKLSLLVEKYNKKS